MSSSDFTVKLCLAKWTRPIIKFSQKLSYPKYGSKLTSVLSHIMAKMRLVNLAKVYYKVTLNKYYHIQNMVQN